uniref:Fibronectin type-III domain-containing protein n=1 Tax=Candidatus Kentrum sp. FM TaxID=2126340 RepID=A0A450TMN7_9GAMM|nr:MAG: hypothetical protein BECKFM1743A_GA0114220_103915 [Candidatus Kentron sp. FM]VFJ68995.1 MAG: hypothetical protein BECKFM1743C_GA0114222_105075 [Candidatus Kentron sp. FM]VFK17710.1 MAG: hypothetical protein BECKFM1743B_GA0114221_104985 [Candidatus Kentron sp. FM]
MSSFPRAETKIQSLAHEMVTGRAQDPRRAGSARVNPSLTAPRQGSGWIALDWKEPGDGGKVAAYKVQRREGDSEDWVDGQAWP